LGTVFLTMEMASMAHSMNGAPVPPDVDRGPRVASIQTALQEAGLDGWLLADFRGRNVLANRVLQRVTEQQNTRRWFYWIPAQGEPVRICHAIEPRCLDGYPGALRLYAGWRQLHEVLQTALQGARRVAMEYSPNNDIPYVSLVDAGTVELVRGLGVEVVSSADLVQRFEAVWTDEQRAMHMEAARRLLRIKDRALLYIRQALLRHRPITEYDVQQYIWRMYRQEGLVADHPPIVAVNQNASNPHYTPTKTEHAPIRMGDLILIDLWAKLNRPGAIYADTTWMAYAGKEVPPKYAEIFQIVYEAQSAAYDLIAQRFQAGQPVYGWEADDAARGVIRQKGYEAYFIHRTGHSIGQEVHGNGANLDNLETRDRRQLLPGTGFSIEPGIYLPEFGVRSEMDVYLDPKAGPIITTAPRQTAIIPLLSWRPAAAP
ncbi:MAG: Xaa-Pro peptidase family protein, partial [Acidobacteriota bacterium]|nr:Xaa-Pro peptidase family protein [Acidobacteriota bacterium]